MVREKQNELKQDFERLKKEKGPSNLVLGIPLRLASYACPDCGRPADKQGIHAVTCTRSGWIGRGHTILRDTLAEILRRAGLTVSLEQSPMGHADTRPADILVHDWQGRPLALDVTVVTPVRPCHGLQTPSALSSLMPGNSSVACCTVGPRSSHPSPPPKRDGQYGPLSPGQPSAERQFNSLDTAG